MLYDVIGGRNCEKTSPNEEGEVCLHKDITANYKSIATMVKLQQLRFQLGFPSTSLLRFGFQRLLLVFRPKMNASGKEIWDQ